MTQGLEDLSSHLETILFDQTTLRARIAEMGAAITGDYHGEPLTIIAVLQGSALFMADLIREIHLPLQIDTLSVSSYQGGTKSLGKVTFHQEGLPHVEDRHVLVVDDILDTGRTISAIKERLIAEANPKSVRTAVLLSKKIERDVSVEVEYTGFEIGEEFVVGYGLDYLGQYRNLPVIGVLKQEYIHRK